MQIILQFSFPMTQHLHQKCVNRIQKLLRSSLHNYTLPCLQFLIIYERKLVSYNTQSCQKKNFVSYLFLCLKSYFYNFPFSKDLSLKFSSNKAKLNTLSRKIQVKQNAFRIEETGTSFKYDCHTESQ